MDPTPLVSSYWLVLALAAGGVALGLLGGLWFGLRVVTKDAALLARFAQDAGVSRKIAEEVLEKFQGMREEWTDKLEDLERKRARARSERQKADEARLKAEAAEQTEPLPEEAQMDALSPRDRRRMVGRRLRGLA